MQWIAPSEKDSANGTLEKRLWDAADQFRTNSGLKAQEYSSPVLGLIFLRFADVRFAAVRALLDAGGVSSRRASRVDDAMRDIEKHNPQLAGVLPKTYNLFTGTLLKELLKKVSEIPATVDYDAFGRIYEPSGARQTGPQASPKGERERANQYFLGEFARTEGQKRGEFYTPSCIVRLLTEVIEPYHGRILDPACGSGGSLPASRLCGVRFAAKDRAIAHGVVQSEKFVESHGGNCAATWRDFRGAKDHRGDISIYER